MWPTCETTMTAETNSRVGFASHQTPDDTQQICRDRESTFSQTIDVDEYTLTSSNDLGRCVDEMPSYLIRIIEGSHRGAVRGQRTRPCAAWPSHCPSVETCEFSKLLDISDPLKAQRMQSAVAGAARAGVCAPVSAFSALVYWQQTKHQKR